MIRHNPFESISVKNHPQAAYILKRLAGNEKVTIVLQYGYDNAFEAEKFEVDTKKVEDRSETEDTSFKEASLLVTKWRKLAADSRAEAEKAFPYDSRASLAVANASGSCATELETTFRSIPQGESPTGNKKPSERTKEIVLKKPPRFQDIPQFILGAPSRMDLPWEEIPTWMASQTSLILIDPDPLQRKEWTLKEKGKYIEYCLQGGFTASSIYFNWNGKPRWQGENEGPSQTIVMVHLILVDGSHESPHHGVFGRRSPCLRKTHILRFQRQITDDNPTPPHHNQ